MDYIIGFLLGYYCRIFFKYLKTINDRKIIDEYDWDWLSTDDSQ
jgi:hypothetical protein